MKAEGRKKRRGRVLIGALLLVLAAVGINVIGNRMIMTTRVEVKSSKLPKSFDGFKIVQLTDLHSADYGPGQHKLLDKVKREEPDLIVITGDLVDAVIYRNNSGYDAQSKAASVIEIAEGLVSMAPVYFVYGNHEMILLNDPDRNVLKVKLEKLGVHILNVGAASVSAGTEHINIVGIQDPSTLYKDSRFAGLEGNEEKLRAMLDLACEGVLEEDFSVLLSHRPEYMELYTEYPIDMALTGHAHGGQFRLPLIGGLWAPNQGFFPKYDGGVYKERGLTMIVGRGLGNSVIKFRIFNTPEIVSVTLLREA